MDYVKKGMHLILGDADHFLKYLNWHDTMELIEKTNLKNYDEIDVLKKATDYKNYTKDHDQFKLKDHDQFELFWKVYEKLNRENKKLFFNFTGGRSHLGDVVERFEKRFILSLSDKIPNDGLP